MMLSDRQKCEVFGMKRICLFLLCLMLLPSAFAQDAADDPAIASFLAKHYTEYTVYSAISCHPDHQFLSLHKESGHNVLLYWRKGSLAYFTDSALPQGRGVELLDLSSGESLAFSCRQANEDSTAWNHVATFERNSGGKWLLISYSTHEPQEVTIRAAQGRMTYWLSGAQNGVTVEGVFERDLQYFSLSTLPKSSADAKRVLSLAPELPVGDLQAQEIQFTSGQKFPVYAYPDENAYRGAKGKAAVSTNDWIQVFGSAGDYILIQYDISRDQFRIGYIEKNALPAGSTVWPLSFASCITATALQPTAVTDDPIGTQAGFLSVHPGDAMTYLACLGDWAYIEITTEAHDLPVRGFVPMSAVQLSPDPEAAGQALTGAWHYDAGSEIYYDHLTFREDGTFTYPYYPDETETEEIWTGKWHIQPYDPNSRDYYIQTGLEIILEGHRDTASFSLRFSQEIPDGKEEADLCLTLAGLNQPYIEGGSLGYRKE